MNVDEEECNSDNWVNDDDDDYGYNGWENLVGLVLVLF